ncbi:MAG: chemotaxis protein CheW [Chloroflexota bacterium]
MTDDIPVLTFAVCQQTYAVSIMDVVEVAAMVETARIGDEISPYVYGVVIRRGTPMILIDLRHLFHCDEAPVTLATLFVVVRSQSDEELTGFIVDQVQEVVYLKRSEIRPVDGGKGYIRGMVAREQVLIQWLDIETIVAHTQPGSLEI